MQQYFKNSEQLSAATASKATVQSNTTPTLTLVKSNNALPVSRSKIVLPADGVKLNSGNLHPVNANVLTTMQQQLELKAYSQSTISTYLKEMNVFLKTIKGRKADEFTMQRIKDYLQYCYTALGLS